MPEEYRISELAEKAGVTKRTVHYYVQRGLLPPPTGAGVNSVYGEGHLIRIRLVKALQERFLPLDNIRDMIAGLSDEEIRKKLESLERGQEDIVPGNLQEQTSAYGKLAAPEPMMRNESKGEEPVAKKLKGNKAIGKVTGKEYIRVDLGKGMELSFPKELLDEQEESIHAIIAYAKGLIK